MKPSCEGDSVGYFSSNLIRDVDILPVPGVGLPGERLVDEGVLQPGLFTGACHNCLLLGLDLGPVELVPGEVLVVFHLIIIENVSEYSNKRSIMLDVEFEGSESKIAVVVVKMLTFQKLLFL